MASNDDNTGNIESKDDVMVDIENKDNDGGHQNVAAITESDVSSQSIDTILDNDESKSEEKAGNKIEDNEGGGQTSATSAEPDVLPQPIDAIPRDETNVNPNEMEAIIEELGVEVPNPPQNPPPIPPPVAIELSDHFIDTLFCGIPCYGCLRGFAKNIELCLIFPLNFFLAFYHLITVFKFDSYCVDCKPKLVVFGIENVTMTGNHYYASDFTHLSMCSAVITCTFGCAMLLCIFRHWISTLFYGAVMLTLATLCFVIPFYFVGAYLLVVSIVVLIIAGLRIFGVIVMDPEPAPGLSIWQRVARERRRKARRERRARKKLLERLRPANVRPS